MTHPHRLRKLQTVSEPHRPYITLNGQQVLDFSSNDYLGFSQHPALIQAVQDALTCYGVGTGSARLISGTLDLHTALEEKISQFKGTEKALVFNSGYQANIGVLSGLIQRADYIFADKLNHASLVDGALLSRAKLNRYRHLDMDHLEALLTKTPHSTKKWIVTDTVFSMDGDLAPLKTLHDLACRYEAMLILDEAHATGIFGETYRSGLWETTGLGPQPNVIQIGTFSKALGSFGAYVAGTNQIIDALIQSSRSFIYSTSLPPSVIAANLAALDLLETDATATNKLWENIRYLQNLFIEQNILISGPIVPIVVHTDEAALSLSQQLLAAGFYVQAIRPPTVPEGTARLRLSITASHTESQLSSLINSLPYIMRVND